MASISDILVQSASLPTGNCGDDEDGGNCGDVNVGAVTIKDCGDDDNSFGGGDSCGGGGGIPFGNRWLWIRHGLRQRKRKRIHVL